MALGKFVVITQCASRSQVANVNVPRNVCGWTAWRQTRKHPNLEPSPRSHRRKRNFLCFLTSTRDHEPSELKSVFPTLRPVRLGWAKARSSTPGHRRCQGCPQSGCSSDPASCSRRAFPWQGRLLALPHRAVAVCPLLPGSQAGTCSGVGSQQPRVSPSLAAGALIQFSSRALHAASGGGQIRVLGDTVGSSVTRESRL